MNQLHTLTDTYVTPSVTAMSEKLQTYFYIYTVLPFH